MYAGVVTKILHTKRGGGEEENYEGKKGMLIL